MKINLSLAFLCLLILLERQTLLSQTDTVQNISKLAELRQDLEALVNSPDLSNSFIGISVQDLESGEYIFRLNDDKNFVPASTIKLITTLAALEYFGKDFRYQTNMYLDGELHPNGEFIGDVIIRGSGDPTISKSFYAEPLVIMETFAKKLDSLGIKTIVGNIIADDSYFDQIHYGPGWSWDDFMYPFSSQISAFSFNDNTVTVSIFPGDSVNFISKFNVYPENNLVRILNYVTTSSADEITEISANRDIKTNFIELFGIIAFDSTKKSSNTFNIAIDNPTMYFLDLFRNALSQQRIRLNGLLMSLTQANKRINYSALVPVFTHISPPLQEIIKVINSESHNLCAEMLFKTLAKENLGIGSFDNGAMYLNTFLKSIGIQTENLRVVDGSGLSRFNLFSPRNFVTLLNYAYRSGVRDKFIASLAEPGEEGTLKRRMKRSRAENNVKAKTGSMNNISSICGYVQTRDNESFAFSIMMQNFTSPLTTTQNLQDLILMRLASFSRK